MSTATPLSDDDWRRENLRRWDAATARLLTALRTGAARFDGSEETPLALEELARIFSLGDFERDLILLCALRTRDRAVADALRVIDFATARSLLRAPSRTALSPAAPLRYWHLIELRAGAPLELAALDLDERVAFYLEGHQFLEPRLSGLVQPRAPRATRADSRAARLAQSLARHRTPGDCPVVELGGSGVEARRAFFSEVCGPLGLQPWLLDARDLPASAAEREALARLWERESMLAPAALLIDADTAGNETAPRLRSFLHSLEALVFVSGTAPRPGSARGLLTVEPPPREIASDVARWHAALGPLAQRLNGSVERTAWQFDLDEPGLATAAAAARAAADDAAAARALWAGARAQARRGLDSLAPRIDTRADWDDLVLPTAQLETLRQIAVHVRQRHRVYREWGFADRGMRGLGVAALFSGGSGTGKTLAAEVLANELQLDLHRIDLARVVSKYIGETEKNLARVFDAAESSGAILLFDEADALFGKRSEVRDSHDRYANIEVSYLLQRIETYRGLSILTTNLKQSIDGAFLRRLRFIVQFPFPDDAARRDIWARIFPAAMPRDALDLVKLARLNLAGGHIRNIALNAAFLAADEQSPVGMAHLRRAAETEFTKLERALPRADVGDWT
jgi:hypothetical protein